MLYKTSKCLTLVSKASELLFVLLRRRPTFYKSVVINTEVRRSCAFGPCTAFGRRTAGKLGGTRASSRYRGGTRFEIIMLVSSRSQIDSTLSPEEGKWQ